MLVPVNVRSRRSEDLLTAAAVTLLLLTGLISQTWVVGLAAALLVAGLIAFPTTRQLGLFAALLGAAAAIVAVVFAQLVR